MNKKESIKLAFIDLMIEKGIRNINMSEVFTKAETGSGTFYNYYKSKDELIEELFFDYVNDFIRSIRIEIPADLEIKNIKPIIMQLLDNIINVLTTKKKNLQVLSILGPEFTKKSDCKTKEDFESFQKSHDKMRTEWSWLDDIFKKGQEMNQIVNLNPRILGRMLMGVLSHLFVPMFNDDYRNGTTEKKRFDGDKISEEEVIEVKDCVWNMLSVHQ